MNKAGLYYYISSTTGTRGNAGQTNYAAGKAGIIGVTKTLAKDWGQFNIQVNAVAFGFIETRLTQAKESGERITESDLAVRLRRRRAQCSSSSPLSDYVSGQVLEVTGGL